MSYYRLQFQFSITWIQYPISAHSERFYYAFLTNILLPNSVSVQYHQDIMLCLLSYCRTLPRLLLMCPTTNFNFSSASLGYNTLSLIILGNFIRLFWLMSYYQLQFQFSIFRIQTLSLIILEEFFRLFWLMFYYQLQFQFSIFRIQTLSLTIL